MLLRQLYDPKSSTYTYLLGCEENREGVIIDPVFEQFGRDAALARELGLRIKYCLDTHVHADHVTAAWLFQQSGAEIVQSGNSGAAGIDVEVADGDVLAFGDESLTVMETPGHTGGCLTYVTANQQMAFTGDCLLIRGSGRTDFQAGDPQLMWRSIKERIFALPETCLLYPGHDYQGRTVSSVREEKKFNPRIGGEAHFEDFQGYMDNLNLPHPMLLDIAVPANLQCGKPDNSESVAPPDWAPVIRTFAGVPEIQPDWVARNYLQLQIIDVRSEAEFQGEHLEGSTCIPLPELRQRLDEVDVAAPTVVVCQSGKRSAMATQILEANGCVQVANIPGGLIHWGRLALPHLVAAPIGSA